MKKWINSHPISSMLIGSLLFCIVLTLWGVRLWGSSFIQDFGANWLATFLGVVIGVPLALWVNRYQENTNEREHKKKILSVLKVELTENLLMLHNFQNGEQKELYATTLYGKLKDESWTAFSDGGELKWIKDPLLISQLSDAYNMIRNVKSYSEKFLYLTNNVYRVTMVINHMWKTLDGAVEYSFSIINESLQAINKNM